MLPKLQSRGPIGSVCAAQPHPTHTPQPLPTSSAALFLALFQSWGTSSFLPKLVPMVEGSRKHPPGYLPSPCFPSPNSPDVPKSHKLLFKSQYGGPSQPADKPPSSSPALPRNPGPIPTHPRPSPMALPPLPGHALPKHLEPLCGLLPPPRPQAT